MFVLGFRVGQNREKYLALSTVILSSPLCTCILTILHSPELSFLGQFSEMRLHYLVLCAFLLPEVLAVSSRLEWISSVTCKVACAAMVAKRWSSAGFPPRPSATAAFRTIFEPQSVEYRYCKGLCAHKLEYYCWTSM